MGPAVRVTPAEQAVINARGIALCRQALGRDREDVALDPDCPIRDAALRRARQEKRERKVRNPEMPSLIAQATAHMTREDA